MNVRRYAINDSGISLITAMLVLMVFALFLATAVSLITTSSNVGLQEEFGVKALFIAEGGLQYALMGGSYCTYAFTNSLGGGSFTTASQLNSAAMSGTIDNTTDPVDVPLAAAPSGFTVPGTIKIDSEYLFCTGTGATSFAGCERATEGSAIASHTNASVTQCAVTSTGTISTGLPFGAVTRQVLAVVGE